MRPSLVLGANGLVGGRLAALLAARGEAWVGTCRRRSAAGLRPLDVTDPGQLAAIFAEIRPAVVYHCANLAGGVDFCESHPDEAAAFHLEATRELGRRCAAVDAALVFISTDYVFDGTAGPYHEDDPTHPLNHYGRLKLEAEQWLREHLERHVIARTTNVFGWDPRTVTPNFLMGLLRGLAAGRPVNVPSFLWGNPTEAGDLAAALRELAGARAWGVHHVVGSSFIDRLTWARKACDVFGLDASLLREVVEPPTGMVPRPLRSWLATDRFTARFTTALNDVDAGLARMKRERDADAAR
jgi:dTDP-4-dehydrorhamnose reductase